MQSFPLESFHLPLGFLTISRIFVHAAASSDEVLDRCDDELQFETKGCESASVSGGLIACTAV